MYFLICQATYPRSVATRADCDAAAATLDLIPNTAADCKKEQAYRHLGVYGCFYFPTKHVLCFNGGKELPRDEERMNYEFDANRLKSFNGTSICELYKDLQGTAGLDVFVTWLVCTCALVGYIYTLLKLSQFLTLGNDVVDAFISRDPNTLGAECPDFYWEIAAQWLSEPDGALAAATQDRGVKQRVRKLCACRYFTASFESKPEIWKELMDNVDTRLHELGSDMRQVCERSGWRVHSDGLKLGDDVRVRAGFEAAASQEHKLHKIKMVRNLDSIRPRLWPVMNLQ